MNDPAFISFEMKRVLKTLAVTCCSEMLNLLFNFYQVGRENTLCLSLVWIQVCLLLLSCFIWFLLLFFISLSSSFPFYLHLISLLSFTLHHIFYACSLPSHPPSFNLLSLSSYLSISCAYLSFLSFVPIPTLLLIFLILFILLTHIPRSSRFFFIFIQLIFSFSPGLMTRVWSLIRRPSQSGPWC